MCDSIIKWKGFKFNYLRDIILLEVFEFIGILSLPLVFHPFFDALYTSDAQESVT